MSAAVPLGLIVSVLAAMGEDDFHYLDTKSGEVVSVYDPFESDETSELLEIAVTTEQYVPIPSFEEIEEARIPARFASEQDETVRGALLAAAQSIYARASFPQAVREAGLQSAWDAYRDAALEAIALEWAAEHNLVLTRPGEAKAAPPNPIGGDSVH